MRAARLVAGLGACLVAAALAGCAPLARSRAAVSQDCGGEAVARAEQAVTDGVLRAPIRFLADDALEGRGPGTRGDVLARLYISTTLQLLGVAPALPDGGYEQPVELLGVTTRAPKSWTFRAGGRRVVLDGESDYVVVSGAARERVSLDDAELVFVGYGIEAPEYGWDDFKGADLRGKVLLILNDDPDWDPELFAGERRLYYGRWTYKYESAARQGAAGAIILHTTQSAGYPWQTVQASWRGESSRLASAAEGRGLAVEAWLQEDAARRVVALGGRDLDELVRAARSRDFAPVPLGVTTSLALSSEVRRYETANVVGVLRGSDPALRDEYVVYTAHHDHLGTTRDADGREQIHNGALDNAAGAAQLLAIARAFAALPEPPRRSVLFVATGAEEQGLLGAEAFVADPPVPLERVVASFNIDGGNPFGRTRDVGVIGLGKSTLDQAVARAAACQGRTIGGDPFPDRGLFYRSDQFSFARAGVPALFLRPGIDFVDRPPGWGRVQYEAWEQDHYHQPSDDYDPAWDLSGMIEDVRLAFVAGLLVANDPSPPCWLPGDEFAPRRPCRVSSSSP